MRGRLVLRVRARGAVRVVVVLVVVVVAPPGGGGGTMRALHLPWAASTPPYLTVLKRGGCTAAASRASRDRGSGSNFIGSITERPLEDQTHEIVAGELDALLRDRRTADESDALFHAHRHHAAEHAEAQHHEDGAAERHAELVRDDASGNTLSPDGTHYAYADWSDDFKLYVSSLDGSSVVKVADNPGTSLVFSPDGTRAGVPARGLHRELLARGGRPHGRLRRELAARIRDCAEDERDRSPSLPG